MTKSHPADTVSIGIRAQRLARQVLAENPKLSEIVRSAQTADEMLEAVGEWARSELDSRPAALAFYRGEQADREAFMKLTWSDFAAVRLMDYVDHAGHEVLDLNLRGRKTTSEPFKVLWLAVTEGRGGATDAFFEDMLHLFRQLSGRDERVLPSREQVEAWMERHPSGLDPRMIKLREENRDRILHVVIDRIDRGDVESPRYKFDPGMSRSEKFARALEWWEDVGFHWRFAVRDPDTLNEMLGHSLDRETWKLLHEATGAGIPIFVNPYYLSLFNVRTPDFAAGADAAIRQYVIYNKCLVDEFGHIVAWEKEDLVQPGEPNAAGWLLPPYPNNIHRRYPEVAILIPDTTGRACGGLCAACQRMFDFQSGHLNFDLEALRPKERWWDRLPKLMAYFENDSQLRDILITGGDALMSADQTLKRILDAVLAMAKRKREANRHRPDGKKCAEMVRIRLGTRLPVYLPMRVTDSLQTLLADFKIKASKEGIKQFVIQTHFETAAEVTPHVREAVHKLISAGWTVTNQLVFTAAASRRGHTAQLRKVLNDVGVIPYYTFSVKGYMENYSSFATNARAVQEQIEEKVLGTIPEAHHDAIRQFPLEAERMVENIDKLRNEANLPFLATDRNVLNLPGVGKSLAYRVIGITRAGRRILEFDHDHTRNHSPIIEKMGKVIVIESKPISEYLHQLEQMGEDPAEYQSVWGYSMGKTEPREPVYEYPAYDFSVTDELTNLRID